jgi:transposase
VTTMDDGRLVSDSEPTRFIGLDVHQRYVAVVGVNGKQQVVLAPRRVYFEHFDTWIRKELGPGDAVALEASCNTWHVHDQLAEVVGWVVVAHAGKVRQIAETRVKTDARDALVLARLLAARMVPQVWIPPDEVRELRSLVSQRQRLVKQRTMARNRLHAVLMRHNLVAPAGDAFGPAHRSWWNDLEVPASQRLQIRHDLGVLDSLKPYITEVETELVRQSTLEPWAGQVAFLVQLPGIGVLTAMVLLSAIGDIQRFAAPRKLVGYSGLGAGVHQSGQVNHSGRITKEGRRELRAFMVDAAWVAVEHSAHWKGVFERLAERLGKPKAIVAIARKLLVAVWHVLTEHVADRHARPEQVARKFLIWSWKLTKANRHGLTTAEFIRRELQRLHIGDDLTEFTRGGKTVRVAPVEVRVGTG